MRLAVTGGNMQQIAGFDFFPLQYDGNGNLLAADQFNALAQAAAASTDVILLAHGFRNDENDATSLYTRFLTSFRGQLGRTEFQNVAIRKTIVAGVYWPSKSYQEAFPADSGAVQDADATAAQIEAVSEKLRELQADATPEQKKSLDEAISLLPRLEHQVDAQDQFVSLVLSILPADDDGDAMEGLKLIRSQSGSDLLNLLRHPVVVPARKAPDDGDAGGGVATVSMASPVVRDGGVQGIGALFGSILGGAGKLANMTTWYQMKSRSGVVGETGVARAMRALKGGPLKVKVHLLGHSLGGRLMAACTRALSQDPIVHPDSLTLLEAAFSHFGFSPNNGQGLKGFFRDVIAAKVIKGPMLETFSEQDTVVGYVYAIASRLAGDNVKAIGDASDPFGGIGRNGAQKTPESVVEQLHEPGTPYLFKSGLLTNLDGSGGLITSHGDVTNDHVTYAFAAAVAAT
jgi:hypothetical protein